MSLTLFLVRHGETAFNDEGAQRIRGRVDIPLNDKGLRHAQQAGGALKDQRIDLILYSSIPRAKQTAEEIFSAQRASNPSCRLEEEPLLIDISWGDWEGKLYTEAFTPDQERLFATDPHRIVPAPNGESFYQVLDRLHRLFARLRAQPERRVCLVSHGAILNLVMCYLTESPLSHFWDFYGAACAITELTVPLDGSAGCRIRGLNRSGHLA